MASADAGGDSRLRGDHVRIEGGKLLYPPVQSPYPPLYFGGSSDAGQDVAAEHCDVYLSWGEPPSEVAGKLSDAKRRAAAFGRTLSYGIRLHVIVRETAEQAWRDADALIRHVDDAAIAFAQRTFSRFDSVGQQRMTRLHDGRRDRLEVSPIFGRVLGSCEAAREPLWSEIRSRWPPGCANTWRLGSIALFCPDIRIWKSAIVSPSLFFLVAAEGDHGKRADRPGCRPVR